MAHGTFANLGITNPQIATEAKPQDKLHEFALKVIKDLNLQVTPDELMAKPAARARLKKMFYDAESKKNKERIKGAIAQLIEHAKVELGPDLVNTNLVERPSGDTLTKFVVELITKLGLDVTSEEVLRRPDAYSIMTKFCLKPLIAEREERRRKEFEAKVREMEEERKKVVADEARVSTEVDKFLEATEALAPKPKPVENITATKPVVPTPVETPPAVGCAPALMKELERKYQGKLPAWVFEEMTIVVALRAFLNMRQKKLQMSDTVKVGRIYQFLRDLNSSVLKVCRVDLTHILCDSTTWGKYLKQFWSDPHINAIVDGTTVKIEKVKKTEEVKPKHEEPRETELSVKAKLLRAGVPSDAVENLAAVIQRKHGGDIVKSALGKREYAEHLQGEDKAKVLSLVSQMIAAAGLPSDKFEAMWIERSIRIQNTKNKGNLDRMIARPLSANQAKRQAAAARAAAEREASKGKGKNKNKQK